MTNVKGRDTNPLFYTAAQSDGRQRAGATTGCWAHQQLLVAAAAKADA